VNVDISQGDVATRLGCGGVFKYFFVTNFLQSLTVKEFWKLVNLLSKLRTGLYSVLFFWLTCIKFIILLQSMGQMNLKNNTPIVHHITPFWDEKIINFLGRGPHPPRRLRRLDSRVFGARPATPNVPVALTPMTKNMDQQYKGRSESDEYGYRGRGGGDSGIGKKRRQRYRQSA